MGSADCKDVSELMPAITEAISGVDHQDATSSSLPVPGWSHELIRSQEQDRPLRGLKLGIPEVSAAAYPIGAIQWVRTTHGESCRSIGSID